jgi:hypothetical protein
VVVVAADAEEVVLAAEGHGGGAVGSFVAHVAHENNRRSAVCVIRLVEQRLELVQAAVHVTHDQRALLQLRRFHCDNCERRLDAGE